MDREEFREQMGRCQVCGALMDGGCCEPPPGYAKYSRRLEFCAGPNHHTFYACEKHKAHLEKADVICFFGTEKHRIERLDMDDETECDFCREG